MSAPTRQESAEQLSARGFRTFPLIADAKLPQFSEWQAKAGRYTTWWAQHPDSNIGVATGQGLLVLDFDVKKGGLDTLAMLELEHGVLETYRVNTPSGGVHLYLHCPRDADIRNSADHIPNHGGLDVRGEGGLVVGASSTINGVPYTANNRPVLEAPDWVLELARSGQGRSKAVATTREPLVELDQPDALRRAVIYLQGEAPTAELGNRGWTTYKIACRCREFGLSEATAAELIGEHWNETKCDPPQAYDVVEQQVNHAYRYATGGWGGASALADFDPVEIAEPKNTKFAIRHIGDLDWQPKQDYVIKNLLLRGMTGLIAAVSNAGKSPLALDIGAHVALGKPWQGFKVRQGAVFYIATEGWTALNSRLKAVEGEHPGLSKAPFFYWPTNINLREPPPGWLVQFSDEVIARAAEHRTQPSIIFIDTLSHAVGGASDSDDDVARAAIRSMRVISQRTGAAVIALHHPTKAADSDYRGSSVWINDTDLLIKVEWDKAKGTRTVTTPRVKESAEMEARTFCIKQVTLGQDEEGDPVTSVVVNWLERGEELDGFRSIEDEAALDVLEDAERPLRHSEWLTGWAARTDNVDVEGKPKRACKAPFNNAVNRLRKADLVLRNREMQWERTSAER